MEKGRFKKGDSASASRTFTESDVNEFARVTGDFNPVHTDKEKAEQSAFGRRIVHGMLAGSLVSAVLAERLPGPGTVYLEQVFKFRAPLFIGEACTAEVCITDILNYDKGIYRMDTKVLKQDGTAVLEGHAVVMHRQSGKGRTRT